MSTHFNAQINSKDGKYSIQFETDQRDLYKLVEKTCQFAIDTAAVRKSEMEGDNP